MSQSRESTTDAWLDRPVLIYGPNKSGTTLLQSLLDGSSRMLVYPGELKLKALLRQGHRPPQERKADFLRTGRGDFRHWLRVENGPGGTPRLSSSARRTFGNLSAEDMGRCFDQESYLQSLSAFESKDELSDAEILKQDTGALRGALTNDRNDYDCWASKEVGGQPAEVCDYFLSMFPAGRFVYLAREPRSVVRSIVRDRRRRMGQRLRLKEIARRCHYTQRFVNFFATQRRGSNSLLVLYEQLVGDPERELRRITKFLELPFEDIMRQPTILGQSVVVVTSSRDTREVFDATSTPWTQDLTLREKLAVRSYFCAARFSGRTFTPYSDLQRS